MGVGKKHNQAKLSGHKSSITQILFLKEDTILATGSLDTTIIIWDLIAETALYKFKGHKNSITRLGFMTKVNLMLSSSKDGYIRVSFYGCRLY